MTRQKVRVDCRPRAVKPWRLERVDDTVWITFDEDVPRPLGASAEVIPVLRGFFDEVGDGAANRWKKEKPERRTSCST